MRNWTGVTLIFVLLSVSADIHAAQTQPMPENPLRAQTSLGFNISTRCPDLRIADEGTIAVVVFWLTRTGNPSQLSIKSSSGSNALDSAAINCVSRLRFAPATTLGDGDPIDSWQQIALRWAKQANADETRAMTSPSAPIAGNQAQIPANAGPDISGDQANSVTVHVCVDEKGKLEQDPTIVHSSGIASLDQAAVRFAASGSAGLPVSRCARLAIQFDAK